MRYNSTRGGIKNLSFIDTVMMGLAEDGGLLIPAAIPQVSTRDLKHMSELSYERLFFEVAKLFIDDIPHSELKNIIAKSHLNFDVPQIIPVVQAGGVKIAEVFHGPTYAFKDMALQFLGNLFEYILKTQNRKLNILGATSGDTGSAAIYGVKGKENINIFMLYPKARISDIQELQMTTVPDANVFPLSTIGNFDICQDIVKDIFNDIEFKHKYNLGAVNSINFARILAQVVYYFHIYFKACGNHIGDKVNIVVPTGNFGNIFAAYFARRMGLPISKLVLATNRNNILTRAVKFGDYSIEKVHPTFSPSMDIQSASNFERYLYYVYDGNTEHVNEAIASMKSLSEIELRGQCLGRLQRDFIASDASDDEIISAIRLVHAKSGYIIDPHTACGVHAAYELETTNENTVCLATAHPAKFPDVINSALGLKPPVPDGLLHLNEKIKKVDTICADRDDIKKYIVSKLG